MLSFLAAAAIHLYPALHTDRLHALCSISYDARERQREAISFCPGLIGYISRDGFILTAFSAFVKECVQRQ